MRTGQAVLIASACLAGIAAPARAQSDWCQYRPHTFRAFSEDHADDVGPNSYGFSGDQFPSRMRVVYAGRSQPIPPHRRFYLTAYFDGFLRWTNAGALFEREFLFREDSSQYWLPIQEMMAPDFEREVSAGDTLWVFVLWTGTVSDSVTTDWIFLINEFTSRETEAHWDEALKGCPAGRPKL